MPRVNDIPEHLLSPEMAQEFVEWLKQWPVTTAVRRTLIALWTNASSGRLTEQQLDTALRDAL